MKHLTFIKNGISPCLNHFYEHLYCIELGRELRKQGFFNYTDYRIEARNYHTGFIYVTTLLYNAEILKHVNVTNISPSFFADDIELAALQISAEHNSHIKYNEVKVLADLKKLHANPWENIDNSEFHNWRHTKTGGNYSGLSTSSIASSNFRNMVCKIILDQEFALKNETVLPLFRELSKALLYNLSDVFTDIYGYFGLGHDSVYSGAATWESHSFRIHQKHMRSAQELQGIAKKDIAEQLNKGLKQSLLAYLQAITDARNYFYEDIATFEVTGVLVGDKGWEILSNFNAEDVLKHCLITIKAGNETKAARVIE